MAADVARHLAPAGGMTDMDRIGQVERLGQRGQVALHRRDRGGEGAPRRRRLEYTRPRAFRAGLHGRQLVAEPCQLLLRDAIAAFLAGKRQRELDYRLIKELWSFHDNRIAVRFAYEWHDDSGNWFRSYGNENWEFDHDGLMRRRIASINDAPIAPAERKFHWPLGRRPDDHPSLERSGPLTRPRPGPMRVSD